MINIDKPGYITKTQVFQTLREKYNIDLPLRTLQFYIDMGLLPYGIREHFPEITGSVGFYLEKTPLQMASIWELDKIHNFTIKEIAYYKNILYKFDPWLLQMYLTRSELARKFEGNTIFNIYKNRVSETEKAKFTVISNYFICSELGIKYNDILSEFEIDGKLASVKWLKWPDVENITVIDNIITEVKIEIQVIEYAKTPEVIREIVYRKEGFEIVK